MNPRLFTAFVLLLGAAMPAFAGVRVAVVPFDNGGADEFGRLGVGLQSMITTDLSQDDEVTVVERERLQDLVQEMGLAEKGVVDPVTAAKMGKVLGATHVVAGTYVVVGSTMRLDARLTNVQTGAVAGVSADGEKDAFFELEKKLVSELLEAVGAELTPKERAAISKVHTADFDSFSEFSKGVALFDENRYDEALAVLRKVTEADGGFTLADATASAVADAQKRAAGKAMAARVTEAESRFLIQQESARWEAAQFDSLRKIAFDSEATRADRVSAALYLATLTSRTNRGSFHELKDVSDEFALARVGDRAYQVIWSLLDPEVPRWFPRYSSYGSGLSEERGWDAAHLVTETRKKVFESSHVSQTLADCSHATRLDVNGLLRSLWLPSLQLIDTAADQLRRGAACDGLDPAKVRDAERDLADAYLNIGEVGRAAAILDRQATAATEARELETIAYQLKRVHEQAEILEAAGGGTAEELLRWGDRASPRDAEPDRIAHFLHYRLRRVFPLRDPFFLNGMPMWILSRGKGLGSGPRTGVDVSTSLRHYGDTRTDFGFDRTLGPPDIVVLGGMAERDGTLQVDLITEPTAEWHPHASSPEGFVRLPAVPKAGILVGMADLKTPATCDPVDTSKTVGHPLQAVAAYVDGDALVLARIQGRFEDLSCGNTRDLVGVEVVEELGRRPIRRVDGTLSVKVAGNVVKAELGKVSLQATLPEPVTGFIGLYAEGEGYLELSKPRWK